jgi:hypothetical protein
MDSKMVKDLIKAHRDLTDKYREAAGRTCAEGTDPHMVYELVKESMFHDSKARRLEMRWSHLLLTK